jgi:hypothetical protein
MSAALDMVQVRWQQIRVMEVSQVTERDNVALRKKLNDISSKGSKVNSEALKKFVSKVETFILKNKNDITKLKLHFIHEINTVYSIQSTLKAAFNKAMCIIDEKDSKYMDCRAENKVLSIQLLEAQQRTKDSVGQQETEIAKLKGRIDKLRADKSDMQQKVESMQRDHSSLVRKNDELIQLQQTADAKHEVSHFIDPWKRNRIIHVIVIDCNCRVSASTGGGWQDRGGAPRRDGRVAGRAGPTD